MYLTDIHQNLALDMPLRISQKSPSQALKEFQDHAVDCAAEQRIVASHDSSTVSRAMFRMLKCGNFNLQAKPEVVFSNEAGLDADGLARELCHMVMTALREGKGDIRLFEGVVGHLLPIHNELYIVSKYFEYAGKLIAHAVIHAGFGLVGLSRVVAEYLIEDDIKCLTHFSVEDIPDFDIRSKI